MGDATETGLLALLAKQAAQGQINVVFLHRVVPRYFIDATASLALPIGTTDIDCAAPGPSKASAPELEVPSSLRQHGAAGTYSKAELRLDLIRPWPQQITQCAVCAHALLCTCVSVLTRACLY